jgi:hypothetical protein
MSKKIQVSPSTITSDFYYYLTYLSTPLSVCCGDFLSLLLFGILFAVAHRRTVTTWIRAAKLSRNFRQAYYLYFPKFLGGADEQIYAILKTEAHIKYHELLREALSKKGLWEKVFTYGTHKGSAKDWIELFKENPGSQYQAFEAVLEAGTELFKKYPEESMKLIDAFWDSLNASKWTPY